MNIKNMSKTSLLVLAFGAATMASSQAAYINGEIQFSGVGKLNKRPATAISIDFRIVSTTLAFDDYAPIPFGTSTTFTDFAFGAPGTVGPNAQSPFWTLTQGPTTYSFDLASITLNQYIGTQRLLEGDGTAYITGFDPTPAHWSLSTSGTTGLITFSSATIAVPDGGTSVALLGGSLFGLAGLRRKFLHN
ncbi:MAG: VPDSG-CTERM sorting domain-containing protein [Verrucomicrobiaceae bacterium]|nr:MAG: VPDSG-CTERM sorting domain-containing protein [Verrucomicrobiaceae bacterium]